MHNPPLQNKGAPGALKTPPGAASAAAAFGASSYCLTEPLLGRRGKRTAMGHLATAAATAGWSAVGSVSGPSPQRLQPAKTRR
jgi:hypothetical protein